MTRFGCAADPRSPARSTAGGTRVVLPAPGGATSTSERDSRSRATISGKWLSIGSGFVTGHLSLVTRDCHLALVTCHLQGRAAAGSREEKVALSFVTAHCSPSWREARHK